MAVRCSFIGAGNVLTTLGSTYIAFFFIFFLVSHSWSGVLPWRGVNGHCGKCSCAALQNEVHVLFHC